MRIHTLFTSVCLLAGFSASCSARLKRTERIRTYLEYSCVTRNVQQDTPILSVITSVYNADEFIEGFLEDMVTCSIFPRCELIMINPNSPGNEEPLILEYCKRYPNIIYERLDHDPGLYAVWNLCIQKARGTFLTNANVDDRHNPFYLERAVLTLQQYPDIDLVYSNFYVSKIPNTTFVEAYNCPLLRTAPFSVRGMRNCFVGMQPVWRARVHLLAGYFDPTFQISGDWAMWNEMVAHGSTFKKIPGISGVYYENPKGLSTDTNYKKMMTHAAEDARVVEQYRDLWK